MPIAAPSITAVNAFKPTCTAHAVARNIDVKACEEGIPGSLNGDPAGRFWLTARFMPDAKTVAPIAPITISGPARSTRRLAMMAPVCANVTSHFDLSSSRRRKAGGGLFACGCEVAVPPDLQCNLLEAAGSRDLESHGVTSIAAAPTAIATAAGGVEAGGQMVDQRFCPRIDEGEARFVMIGKKLFRVEHYVYIGGVGGETK